MDTLISAGILIVLIFTAAELSLLVWVQIKSLGFETPEFPGSFLPRSSGPNESFDRITPDFANTNEIPLDQFKPNFEKPIKLKFEETEEGHGVKEVADED